MKCKYCPDLHTHDQGTIDLKDFVQECNTRIEAARNSIADSKGGKTDAKVSRKRLQKPCKVQLSTEENSENHKKCKPGANARREAKDFNPVQPTAAVKNSLHDNDAQNRDHSFKKIDPTDCNRKASEGTFFYDKDNEYIPSQSTQPPQVKKTLQQSRNGIKKVHWHDPSDAVDRVEEQLNPLAKSSKGFRRIKEVFGSNKSIASISSLSTVQTSNKAAKKLSQAKSRYSAMEYSGSNAPSSRGRTLEEKLKQNLSQSRHTDLGVLVQEQGDIESISISSRSKNRRHSDNASSPWGTSPEAKEDRGRSKIHGTSMSHRRSARATSEKKTSSHSRCEEALSSHDSSEKGKEKSKLSNTLPPNKSTHRLATNISEIRSSQLAATQTTDFHDGGNAKRSIELKRKASRTDPDVKMRRPRSDNDISKTDSGPNKRQKKDSEVTIRSSSSEDAHKSKKSNHESIKNKKVSVVPSKRSRDESCAKADAVDNFVSTKDTQHIKHSSPSHFKGSSRSSKSRHPTQSTGISSQEVPKRRRRGPKAPGKKAHVGKFLDDFDFNFA